MEALQVYVPSAVGIHTLASIGDGVILAPTAIKIAMTATTHLDLMTELLT